MENKHTKRTWGNEMVHLQRKRAERRAKSRAEMPREVKMDLAKKKFHDYGPTGFQNQTGWVNDDAGL